VLMGCVREFLVGLPGGVRLGLTRRRMAAIHQGWRVSDLSSPVRAGRVRAWRPYVRRGRSRASR
jgi:hypothetical protein